ncbi:metallo-beta-lactamase superfamily protein [Cryomyces antarcticus]
MSDNPTVHTCFEAKTGTWQYIVADPERREAVIIDSVLDFDPATSNITTDSADKLLELVVEHEYNVTRILETHVHADHLTASNYLQRQLQKKGQPYAPICIGKRIVEVQATFAKTYGISGAELSTAFDKLFDDGETFRVGRFEGKVLHLPGHTPDHVGYMIGSKVFTGDSIFNPDVGSARCDFPGGSAAALYKSMRTLLALPRHYRLYTGHDYPPDSREADGQAGAKQKAFTTVDEQLAENKHVRAGIEEAEFVRWRSERDSGLPEPRLLHQSLQWNVRAGHLPETTAGGLRLLYVPLKLPPSLL